MQLNIKKTSPKNSPKKSSKRAYQSVVEQWPELANYKNLRAALDRVRANSYSYRDSERSNYERLAKILNLYPLKSLDQISIDDYCLNTTRRSLIYILKNATPDFGLIYGGNNYKFGIYKYKREDFFKKMNKRPGCSNDDTYTWLSKLGDTREEAFNTVRANLVKVANLAYQGDFERIDKLKCFGTQVKWKIAFLYSDLNLLPIYNIEWLREVAKHYDIESVDTKNYVTLQRELVEKKGDKDFLSYYYRLLFPPAPGDIDDPADFLREFPPIDFGTKRHIKRPRKDNVKQALTARQLIAQYRAANNKDES